VESKSRGPYSVKLVFLDRSPLAGIPVRCSIVFAISLTGHARYNPLFVLPVANAPASSSARDASSISYTPGRKTGTGSAAISSFDRVLSPPEVIRGFRQVSLLEIISSTGNTPSAPSSVPLRSLDDIRRSARSPVVVFPECTTSNGRGLLRFADVFNGASVPTKGYNIFLMCVR